MLKLGYLCRRGVIPDNRHDRKRSSKLLMRGRFVHGKIVIYGNGFLCYQRVIKTTSFMKEPEDYVCLKKNSVPFIFSPVISH